MIDVPVGNTYDKEGATTPIERRLVSGFTKAFLDLVPSWPATILEVGCGEGSQLRKLSSHLSDVTLVGLDLPAPSLAERWDGIDAAMVFGTAEHLPFPDGSFDLVVALEVFEHLEDPEVGLREMCRVGRGRVVLSVPREPIWRIGNALRGRYLRDAGNTPGHLQHFSSSAFEQFAARHLDLEEVRRPIPWTMLAGTPRTT